MSRCAAREDTFEMSLAPGSSIDRRESAGWRGVHRFAARWLPGEDHALPWRRPGHELLLLALVAVVALSPVYPVSAQDYSRICLAEALVHGHLSNDACLSNSVDRSSYGGHLYSDKAPGVSLLEVPGVVVSAPGPASDWTNPDVRLWLVRVFSVGVAFIACALLVGRVGEGLTPGFGGLTLVAFALGTLVAPLAATSFAHDVSAALAFGAFLLAWRRRPGLAGLLAGAGVLVDYEAGLVFVALACYTALGGWRPLRRFLIGAAPGGLLLGAYDWAAFGAPWHLSYRYLDDIFAEVTTGGVFGIGVPNLFGTVEVFAGSSGLLVISPVVVLAAYGLVILFRTYRAEATICGIVSAAYILANCGYFFPLGGGSPGPRYLVPAFPFLAVGLGPAFRARPRLTTLATGASLVAATALTLVWASASPLPRSVWNLLFHVPAELGGSWFVRNLTPSVFERLGVGRSGAALVVAGCAAAAFSVALRSATRAGLGVLRSGPRARPSPAALLVGTLCLYLVIAANVFAVFAYPYGNRTSAEGLPGLSTSIAASATSSRPGDLVNYVITVRNSARVAMTAMSLTINVPAGMLLLGPPAVAGGGMCTGISTITCGLNDINADTSTTVRVLAKMTQAGNPTLTAWASTYGIPGQNKPAFTVDVGP